MIVYKFRPSDHVYVGPVELPDGPTIPAHHTRDAPPEAPGHYAVMRRGWVLVEGQAPDEPVPPQPDYAPMIRAERDKRLVETDWLVIRAAETGEAISQEWADYRQALRDVPQQEGFPQSVTWPEQPE
jgi:hypothetical protein